MATTVKKIIKKALQKSGVLTINEEPTAQNAADALDALNAMLSSWSNDSMLVYARAWEIFTLTGGQQDYTMGTGGDFNTGRPINIVSVQVLVGQTSLDVTIVNDEIYNQQIVFKDIPGIPYLMNNDNGFPLVKLRFWPLPSTDYPVNILSEKLLSEYGINDSIDLPPGWERAIIFNLALEICSDYAQDPPAQTSRIAGQSIGLIRKSVNKVRDLDAGPKQRDSGNIYSGWWNR